MLRPLWVLSIFCAQACAGTEPAIPFRFSEGLIWVDVKVPQSSSTLNFLVDTGAGMTVINSTVARRLGLPPGSPATVSAVGVTLTGQYQEMAGATVGDIELSRNVLGLDLDQLSRSCESPVDGLLGMDFFRKRVTEIDFVNQQIRVVTKPNPVAHSEHVRLQFRACGIRVPIRVEGHAEQWVRLDTGCATPLQWVNSDVKESCEHKLAVGLAQLSIPQTTTSLQIAGHRFEAVPTGLHQAPIFPGEAGLLGTGLLSRFSTITIDGRSGWLFLGERRANRQSAVELINRRRCHFSGATSTALAGAIEGPPRSIQGNSSRTLGLAAQARFFSNSASAGWDAGA
jgi:hypothetical protein